MAHREAHRVKDTATGKIYPAKAAAGRELAHLVGGDPKDTLVWFKIARSFPDRFLVEDEDGDWVRLNDASAPVGSLHVRADEKSASIVDRAFDEVLVRAARVRVVERLQTMRGLDLDEQSVMDKAWR